MVKVYTKRGDFGETDLYGGTRISKDDERVACYGTLDEVNSSIGLAYSLLKDDELRIVLRQIQLRLFVMGAELASDENGSSKLKDRISFRDITFLEETIDRYQEEVIPRTGFIVPGGTASSAALHVARTVARRLERQLVGLKRERYISDEVLKFANRLSDTLFVMAQADEEKALITEIKEKVLNRLGIKMSKKQMDLSLADCRKMAEAAEKKALEIGIPVVFAAVDAGGNLLLLHRMDDSLLASIDIAADKAYTALALKMPTDQLNFAANPGGALYGITTTNRSRIIAFGGGYPVVNGKMFLGGIGVSGGTVEQDMEIARFALNSLE